MLTTLQNNVPNKVTFSRYMVYIRLTVAFVRRNTSYTTEKKINKPDNWANLNVPRKALL